MCFPNYHDVSTLKSVAVQTHSNDRQTKVGKRADARRLANRTIAALEHRSDFVWVGGEQTGTVQRQAQRIIRKERPNLYGWGFQTDDGQYVTVWSTTDTTFTGPGTGRMIAFWGEGSKGS